MPEFTPRRALFLGIEKLQSDKIKILLLTTKGPIIKLHFVFAKSNRCMKEHSNL